MDKRGRRRAAVRRSIKAVAKRFRGGADAPKAEPLDVKFIDSEGATIATICAEPESTLLAIAKKANIELDHFCGGQCSCGTCRVNVMNGAGHLSKMSGMEEMTLGAKHVANGCRLACQARPRGPVTIQVPRWF